MASAEVNPLDDGEMQLWFNFLQVATYALDQLDREMQEAHAISLADYEIFVALSESPDRRVMMSTLAELALVSASRLTYRVDRLEERGLVRREPCGTDGRRIYAILTDKGLAKLEAAYPVHLAGVRRYLVDPPRGNDRAPLVRSLAAMLAALREVRDVPDLGQILGARDAR